MNKCCPECGSQNVEVTNTKAKAMPGKHYRCNDCVYEWQDRVIRRYRQRQAFSYELLKKILERRSLLNTQERFFIDKIQEKGRLNSTYHVRLLRIAHKIGLDLRETK